MKLQPAHKRGYFVINHKQIALLLAASLIQMYIFKRSIPFRGSAPGPMQGEVSPYDPLFSAHSASSSQRLSLHGTQNTLSERLLNIPSSESFFFAFSQKLFR
jgi:hypothetical protein